MTMRSHYEGRDLREQFAPIAATGDGLNTVVAATPGMEIWVIAYVIIGDATGLIGFRDGGGAVLADYPVSANGGVSYAGGREAPAFKTAAGQALMLNNPAGVNSYGHVTYVVRPPVSAI